MRKAGWKREIKIRQNIKKHISVLCAAALLITMLPFLSQEAEAKTSPNGQTVGSVLFYVKNSAGQQVLVSQIPVSAMEADMEGGKIDTTFHNYSLLDRYTTTVHQEAQGFTIPEFVAYAQSKSTVASLKNPAMTFAGSDVIRLWEIDQTGFDTLDTYTYDDLYGGARYNFPLLYKYWNYTTQEYWDPEGKLTPAQALDKIFAGGEKETVLLSVRAFSQRYMVTDSKYGTGDYNMENLWNTSGLLDNQRTMRFMKPMTKEELYNKKPTAADSRYWVANILLDMKAAPAFQALGSVAAPTAVMTEDGENYSIRFFCDTPGATIYYNRNFISPSYTPTHPYSGSAVVVPKGEFPGGTVTMTARAVKDGYTDAGVVTLKLQAEAQEKEDQGPGSSELGKNSFTDVRETDWHYPAVAYASENELFFGTGQNTFSPNTPMTRGMFVTVLGRMAGVEASDYSGTAFRDVKAGNWYGPYVAWASENSIVSGAGNGEFRPEVQITREQFAAILYRYAQFAKEDVSASGELSAFSDSSKVSAWAADAMKWAVSEKLIQGMGDGTLSPQGMATRAQVAQLFMNFNEIK